MTIESLYRPFERYFKSKRMRYFVRLFGVTSGTQIVDVGGHTVIWHLIAAKPHVAVVNLFRPGVQLPDNVGWVIGDGLCLPFKDRKFDIAFSNSVIEHLGDFQRQRRFAEEIIRVGARYYVQTPNRRFPFELHFWSPFLHFLPKRLQKVLLRNFTLWGLVTRPSKERCEKALEEIRLLDYEEMRELFPGSQILKERFLGLTKSLIAVKSD